MTNTYLVAAVITASLASASAAYAADLAGFAPIAAPLGSDANMGLATSPDIWTGFYAGVHGGAVTATEFNGDNLKASGGAQAGYLQQFGMFVVGAELAATISNEFTYELAPGAGLSQDWSIAAKGRGGVNLGNTLLYSVAGVQAAQLKGTGLTTSDAITQTGVVFGAGVEQSLGNNFSVRAEYLQTRYFDVASSIGGIGRTDDLTGHAITVGANYKF